MRSSAEWPARGLIGRLLLGFLLPLLSLVLWESAVRIGILPNTLIASPSQALVDFFHLLFSGELLVHSGVSVARLLFGFISGSAFGVLLGIWVGVSKFGERSLAPTVQLLAPIPPTAWIPLLIILFGIGEGSKIALLTLGALFVVYLHTVQGIRSTDRRLVDIARVHQKSDTELVAQVLLPSALSEILTGMRVALGLSWILLIAAEVIASSRGLGWLIWDARNFSRPDDMIVGMVTIGILGKLSDSALVAFGNHALRWRRVFEGK